jgi:UDP-glucose 4-epimerase
MRAAVVGGAGYIGSHTVLSLLDRGWDVLVIDNLTTGFREAVPAGVEFKHLDVLDWRATADALTEFRADSLIHFAALTVAPDSLVRPLDYYDNNTGGVVSMLRACVAAHVAQIVFSSTAAVYGDGQVRANEDTPPNPISPYGASKWFAERAIADAARAYGLRAVALRYFNVAGADPKGRAGQSTRNATHLVKIAAQVALGRVASLSVYGTDWPTRDGTGVRDYIHVADLAEGHLRALDWLANAPVGSFSVFNLGSERGASVLEVAGAMSRAAKCEIALENRPRRQGDMAELVADASRAKSLLGWTPARTIDDIAADALAWEKRPDRYG